MDMDAGLAMVAARWHLIDEHGRTLLPRRGLTRLTGLHNGVQVARRVLRDGANPLGGPSGVLVRREALLGAGGWRDDLTPVRDLDMWMRLLQSGDFMGLPEPLAAVRVIRDGGRARDRRDARRAWRALVGEWHGSGAYPFRAVDRTVGRLRGATRRARRRALYAVARVPAGAA